MFTFDISKYTILESITENALDYYRSLAACIVVILSLISNDTSADGEIPCFRSKISKKETNSALFGHFMLYNLPYCLFCYSDEVDHLTHQCPQQGPEHSLSLIFGLLPN